jgi:hypothetical protein
LAVSSTDGTDKEQKFDKSGQRKEAVIFIRVIRVIRGCLCFRPAALWLPNRLDRTLENAMVRAFT